MTPKTTALFERQDVTRNLTIEDRWEEMTEHARKLERAIRKAIDTANGRETEWGERAEMAFQHLHEALKP